MWVRLSRIVQVEAGNITVDELVEEACAWTVQVRVTERIRARMGGTPEVDDSPQRGQWRMWKPQQNKPFTFDGIKVWGN